jgi:hypothetical protein
MLWTLAWSTVRAYFERGVSDVLAYRGDLNDPLPVRSNATKGRYVSFCKQAAKLQPASMPST